MATPEAELEKMSLDAERKAAKEAKKKAKEEKAKQKVEKNKQGTRTASELFVLSLPNEANCELNLC